MNLLANSTSAELVLRKLSQALKIRLTASILTVFELLGEFPGDMRSKLNSDVSTTPWAKEGNC